MLKISNLSKGFSAKSVLEDLNLEIKDGTIFGLVGINGAGKSTLLRCIAGVYQYDAGDILMEDIPVQENRFILRDIFYVSDDPFFPKSATIASLADFYRSFYDFSKERYLAALKIFGLDDKKSIANFSKGMRRQTMLTIALAIKPKLLLLDEAFDGLDPLVRLKVKNLLSDMMTDANCSIIISSHSLKELEDICDTFGILNNGRIDTYGDLLESMANVRKYRLAYDQLVDAELFKDFNIMHAAYEGHFVTLVIKGEESEVTAALNKTKPLVLDSINISFEELFIYEYERNGKDDQ